MNGDGNVHEELRTLGQRFFRAVSFEAGGKPPYLSLYELFIARGLLIRNTTDRPEVATVAEFIEPRQRLVDTAELTSFREWETSEITEIFGNVAHRFGGYRKEGVMNGQPFAGQGVISTQFILTPHGWRISAMAWDDERPGLSVPDRYRGEE